MIRTSDFTLLDIETMQKLLWLYSLCSFLGSTIKRLGCFNSVEIYGNMVKFCMKNDKLSDDDKILCESIAEQISQFIGENNYIKALSVCPDDLWLLENDDYKDMVFEESREKQALVFLKSISPIQE